MSDQDLRDLERCYLRTFDERDLLELARRDRAGASRVLRIEKQRRLLAILRHLRDQLLTVRALPFRPAAVHLNGALLREGQDYEISHRGMHLDPRLVPRVGDLLWIITPHEFLTLEAEGIYQGRGCWFWRGSWDG